MGVSGVAVPHPDPPPPEETNLGQNARPSTEPPVKRPEPVQPPPVERNRAENTQLQTKSEAIQRGPRSVGPPPSESVFPKVLVNFKSAFR